MTARGAALCAMDQGNPVGMTASAFVAVSLNPSLVSVCFKQGSWAWRQLRTRDSLSWATVMLQRRANWRRGPATASRN